jgi:hypothetical protein
MFAKLGASDELVAQGITAVVWARAPRERLEVDVRIETANEAAATTLLEDATKEIAKKERSDGKQIACWRKHSDELYVRREGASVHARVVIDVDGMKGLFNCLDMANK